MATTDEKPGFRERLRQINIAFQFTRKHDKWIVPILLVGFLVPAAVGVAIAIPTGQWLLIPLGVMLGLLLALLLFGRRVQKATYSEVEGKPGAAAAILDTMRGKWTVTPAIAVTPQQDVVHRVVGRPGVILVSEGNAHRLRNVLTQEKKKVSRVLPETPLYTVTVGDGEGEVPLRKVQTHIMKLPRNITPKQAGAVEKRLSALGNSARPPIPKGPMPKSARAMKGAKQQMYRGR